jgi:beta-amylase
MYRDYMAAFASATKAFLGSTIVEIQVGMGPCGELRYPSYMLSTGWNYPGVGLICAHDKGMGMTVPKGEPKDQNGSPEDAQIFSKPSNDDKAFFKQYATQLRAHGKAILKEATAAFPEKANVAFSVKVSGIHWHTTHRSRAAEACAGYVPDQDGNGAYSRIAEMLAQVQQETGRPVFFNFTCLEMRNSYCDGSDGTSSAPEDLIAEVRRACIAYGVPLCGENALQFGLPEDPGALEQIRKQARGWSTGFDKMHSITLLRLDDGFARPCSLDTLREWIATL